MTKPFTGWHMTAILVGFFSTVIAVNVYMAHAAISTFGGTVVDNSYVASQEFNGWRKNNNSSDGRPAFRLTVNGTCTLQLPRLAFPSKGWLVPGRRAIRSAQSRRSGSHLP